MHIAFLTVLGLVDGARVGGGVGLQLFNQFTSLNTPLQNFSMRSRSASEFDDLVLNLLGEASDTGPDHLLGEADLTLNLLNQMLQLGTRSGLSLNLKDPRNLGGNGFLPDAVLLFLSQFSLLLGAHSSALAIFKHEAKSSKLRFSHNALLGRLQISSFLSIQVSAKTSDSVPQDVLVTLDFHMLTVSKNMDTVLLRNNGINTIFKAGDIGALMRVVVVGVFIKGLHLLRPLQLLLQLLLDGSQFLDFTVDLDNGLVDTGISGFLLDFNFILVSINNHDDNLLLGSFLGRNSDSRSGRGFGEDNVFTVIKRIAIVKPVKGLDSSTFNDTSARGVKVGQSLHNSGSKAVLGADGQNILGRVSKTKIFHFNFFSISRDFDRKSLTLTINTSFNLVNFLLSIRSSFNAPLGQVRQVESLGSLSSQFSKSILSNILEKGKFSLDSVKGAGRISSLLTALGQQSSLRFVPNTSLIFFRFFDIPLLFLRAIDNNVSLDNFLFFTLDTKVTMDKNLGGKFFLQSLFEVPNVIRPLQHATSMDFSFPWFSETGSPDRHLSTNLSFFLLTSFLLLTNSDVRFNLTAFRTLATSQDHPTGDAHGTTNFNVFKDFMNGFLGLLFQTTEVINLVTDSLGNRTSIHLFHAKLELFLAELLFGLAHFMASFLPSLLLLLQILLLQLLLLLKLLLRLEDQFHLLVNLLALLLLLQMLLLLILLFLIAFLNSSAVRLTFLLLQFFLAGRDVFRSKAPANSFNLLLNIFRVSSHLDLRNLAFLVSNTHAQEEINFLDFRASRVVVDSHRSSLVAVDRDRETFLLDGLKELVDVKSRFLSLHLQLHVNSKLSWQRNFHLSFRKSALDGLQFLALAEGFVFSNRLRSGERMDIVADNWHLSLVLGLFSLLHGNLDLSISVGNLNSRRDNSMERCRNTSADLPHVVADSLQLHANLRPRSRFRFQFDFSIGKSDKGVPDMHVDLQTRFSGVDRLMSINVKDLKVFNFHSSFKLFLVTFHVFSDFSDDFSGILLIKGVEVLKTQESQEKGSFRLFLFLTINHQLADLLFNLSLVLSEHRFRNIFLASEFRVHFKQLVKNVLSYLHIENRLNKFSISTQSLHLDTSVD